MANIPYHDSDPTRSLRATFLIGMGIMSSIDEIIFHQVLGWHHFYDRSTPEFGLVSDGLLHAANLIFIVSGFFMFSDVKRRQALVPNRAWAGFFMGLGVFQLFDGLVDHKVLRLHQIRYQVNLLPYDIAWNLFGLGLLAVGMVLFFRARSREKTHSGFN